jgi:hypothetical protein
MADAVGRLRVELTRRLEAAVVPGSPNRITAEQLRQMAVEYLDDIQAPSDSLKDPKEGRYTHSNLWMSDIRYEDGLFAVLVFRSDGVEFFCGTGYSFDVQHFCPHEEPDDLDELFAAMRRRFRIPEESLLIDRATAARWLGRSW